MPRAERGKLVKQHGILIDVRADGSVHLEFEGPQIRVDLEEHQLIALRELAGNVLNWDED